MLRGALLLALLGGCRTQPLPDRSEKTDLAFADLAHAPGGSVSCGPNLSCAIADGEHCCDETPLTCQTAPCANGNEFDCDGPEDCNGLTCCFPIRNALSRAACASDCTNGAVLCHMNGDCPVNTVCCLNFVLGPGDGLCLGACD